MLIQETSISATYKKVDGSEIQKAYCNNKGVLGDYFNIDEAAILQIPNEAPVEIPRIMVKTSHEHAQLNISPVVATFEVCYDTGFEKNWNLCSQYLLKRMKEVFEFLNMFTGNRYKYIGIVSSIIYDEIEEDGAKKIVQTLLNSKKIKDIYDVNIKYTFIEKDNIFVNIMLQNARRFKPGLSLSQAGALSLSNQTAESIGAIIDINDRYGFNNNCEYESRYENLGLLLESMSNIIDNKLHSLIEQGEY